MDAHRQQPSFSIVVPVYQEQASIQAFLTHLQQIFSRAGHEIIVVDGSPGGQTVAAVQDPLIKTVGCAPGRSRQMNHGAHVALGEILLFVHADTWLPSHAPELILQALDDQQVVGGAFSLSIDSRDPVLRLVAWVANLRSSWTRVPYGDQAIFMRKAAFLRIGMYPDIPIMEDLELMRRVRKQGWQIRILQECVLTSARRWQQEGKLFCTLRNWFLRVLYHCGVPAKRLAACYKLGRKSGNCKS